MTDRISTDDDARAAKALNFHNDLLTALCRFVVNYRNGEDIDEDAFAFIERALSKELEAVDQSIRSINKGTAFRSDDLTPRDAALITTEDQES